jgi:hypothetical protein
MFCKKCSYDRFTTIKVFRNKDRKDGHWIYSDDADVRRIVCEKCGKQYHTRTELIEAIEYDARENEQFTLALN